MVEQIEAEEDGETATLAYFPLVVTLMARLDSARGLRPVPITMEDTVTMTQALVLDKALATLRMSAVLGESSMGCARPLCATLQCWLEAVLRARGVPRRQAHCAGSARSGHSRRPRCSFPQALGESPPRRGTDAAGQQQATCKTCTGKGSVPCPACESKGRIDGGFGVGVYSCKHCEGAGVKKWGAAEARGLSEVYQQD